MIKRKVLITGGLGYLGGRLSRYLAEKNFEVIVGTSRKKAKLPIELADCSLTFIDLTNLHGLTEKCLGVESVIHLASINSQNSQKDPILAIQINAIGTYNLIQACILSKVKYFLYFSSAHIYGAPLVGNINENTIPKPVHPYSITHRVAEDFLLEAINNKKINGSVLRLSNAIGLPITKNKYCWILFINDACKQAVTEKRIVINSDPNIKRDFLPIKSVCKVTEYFLTNKKTSEYPIFNVGSGNSFSLLQMAKIIATRCQSLYKYYPNIMFSKENTSKDNSFNYNVEKLTKEINFNLDNNLNNSIDEILKYCKAENKIQ